ncbi:conserved hypothetical protein, ribA/ribD-fused [Noviherbaspirillum suwonense]|uniref:NADAR domain-containing protein n=2 Tax=Noviherbaspirillum suwonense TaxID=1224511 RepID=A0ABY1QF79_9BURK|nr:conserved hypothetical protein, ribA/ribD-fused [Noviherbaspirillum suwonense]
MSTRAENSSSSKRLSGPPSGNASSSGGDAKAARKVKKPVVKVLRDDDEDTALPEKKKKSAKTSSSTKPEFQPEKAKDAKPARKAKQPVKEDPSTSSEESGSSSAVTTRRGHKQAEKSASTRATSSVTSPRSDPLGRAILAIKQGNLDDFRRLVPKQVPVDSVSSEGRSLLDIARFEKQPEILRYINQQLNSQQDTGRAIKAIETIDIDALKKLVPAYVQPDAVSRYGRSLLKIARFKQQQLEEIIKYLESQTGEDVLPSRGWIEEDFGKDAYAVGTKAVGTKVRTIEFYDKHSDYYEFTNFYEGKLIEIDGKYWKTAEHYFQTQKFGAHLRSSMHEICENRTAREVYDLSVADKAYWRPDWHQVKLDVMRKVLAAKFGQDENLRKSLCGTGNAQLVEASPKDAFWGYGPDGKGKNMLGKLLMELRTELQEEM